MEENVLAKYHYPVLLGIRFVQVVTVAMFVLGVSWISSDLLMVYVLAELPISALSVLTTFYGIIGYVVTEAFARKWSKVSASPKPKN